MMPSGLIWQGTFIQNSLYYFFNDTNITRLEILFATTFLLATQLRRCLRKLLSGFSKYGVVEPGYCLHPIRYI